MGHGPVPTPHTPSPLRQTLLGSGVRAHPAHKPTEAHKPLQPHHCEEAPCRTNACPDGCLWEERLGGNILISESGDSNAGWVPEERGEAGDPGTGKPGFAKGRVLPWPRQLYV